jgi:oxygen-independent coproporphyrinogen-3 oxidase
MAGIYIHIPFCKQACVYCNFHFSTSLNRKEEMLAAIHTELELQKHYLESPAIETIYLGGGTPSLLTADEINRMTDHIAMHYNISGLKEYTIETNPDDLTQQYIKSLKSTPVNRFSIGTQSFFDSDLQYMNRAHNAQEADYAIKAVQDSGFSNITIDLIYGTPGLTDNNWQYNLQQVNNLGIPHFSAYALTVEEKTALHHNIKSGKSQPVNPEQSAHQFEILMDFAAQSGFEHYEISNLAKPGHRALHNTNYWLGVPYIGIGPSAHSFNGITRQWNIANNALYIKSLLTDRKINFEEEILTTEQRLNEYIMTSLRTVWGLNLDKVTKEWGSDYAGGILKESERFMEEQKLIRDNHSLILTNQGRLFADYIAGELFV